jgi:hypothetical protein
MNKFSKCLVDEYNLYNTVYKKIKDKDATFNHLMKANGNSLQIGWQLEFLKDDMAGKILHIFLKTNDLKTFLINTQIKDYNNFIQFITDNGEYKDFLNASTGKKLLAADFKICLHVPNETSGYSYCLSVDENQKTRIILLHNGLVITMDKEKEKPFPFENPKTVEEFEDYESWKLIINLIYYMNAFPECVFEGIPKGFRLENGFKNKKIQLFLSAKIIEKTIKSTDGREIVPYFRVGHFRYLKSDYFTKKRGQVIFIDTCFVKGKNAKTIIEKGDSYE